MSTFLYHIMSHSTATFSVEECHKNTCPLLNVLFLEHLIKLCRLLLYQPKIY